jgi:hypothetical protein
MREPWKVQRMAAAELCALAIMLAGCADATPTWGPNTPRNGAGQPVDQILGTPIPGYPELPK